jgi:hypothetical protein
MRNRTKRNNTHFKETKLKRKDLRYIKSFILKCDDKKNNSTKKKESKNSGKMALE